MRQIIFRRYVTDYFITRMEGVLMLVFNWSFLMRKGLKEAFFFVVRVVDDLKWIEMEARLVKCFIGE